jgi:hypothetical protein
MARAKEESVARIARAHCIKIRASHLLCLVCYYARGVDEPLRENNLCEMRLRMQEHPSIQVTLTVGANCMACPPCPVFDASRILCYHGHVRTQLRDLLVLRRLGLAPGTTLPAQEAYRRLFAGIETAVEICGWGDMKAHTPEWKACGDADKGYYETVRGEGFLGVSAESTT